MDIFHKQINMHSTETFFYLIKAQILADIAYFR